MAEWISAEDALPSPTQNTVCLTEYWDFSRSDGSLFETTALNSGNIIRAMDGT